MACHFCTGHDKANGGTCSKCGHWYCWNCSDLSRGNSPRCPSCGNTAPQARQISWGVYRNS